LTFSKRPNNREGWHFVITLATRVILLKKLCDPSFEKKYYGHGAGIPVFKAIWDLFDFSLLFSQSKEDIATGMGDIIEQ
jgi:hypothetical protein